MPPRCRHLWIAFTIRVETSRFPVQHMISSWTPGSGCNGGRRDLVRLLPWPAWGSSLLLPRGVEVCALHQPPLTPKVCGWPSSSLLLEEASFTPLSQTGGVPVSHAASINSCAGEGGRFVTKEWDESPGSPPRGVRGTSLSRGEGLSLRSLCQCK